MHANLCRHHVAGDLYQFVITNLYGSLDAELSLGIPERIGAKMQTPRTDDLSNGMQIDSR